MYIDPIILYMYLRYLKVIGDHTNRIWVQRMENININNDAETERKYRKGQVDKA